MTKLLVAIMSISFPLMGQQMQNYMFHLDNGAQVLYQTYSEFTLADQEKAFGTLSASGNIIRRTMLDGTRNPWLAFELHIDRKPGSGPIRFLLSMEQIGSSSFFGQKASPREIENGDRILLDVLEEPGTGRKIFDTFQIGIGIPMQIMPMTKSVPQVPKSGTVVHLNNPRFMNGMRVFAQVTGVIASAKVAISVPDRGRFVFSSQPEPGFRMEAVADGTRLAFVVGNDSYEVLCAAPVIAETESSYLWVRQEPMHGQTALPNVDLALQ
jgi:hypothetical protein